MARGRKKKDEDGGGVVKTIDAERAKRIIDQDILPEQTTIGEHAQAVSTAFKEIVKHCHIPSWVVRVAIKLKKTEDAKREHELRALNAMLEVMGLSVIPADLVDQANGANGTNVIPMRKGEEAAPGLIPLGDDEHDDAAFAEAAGEDPTDLKLAK